MAHYERAFDHPSDDSAYKALQEVAAVVVRHGMLDKLEQHVRRYLLAARDENLSFGRVADVWKDIGEAHRAIRWLERSLESSSDANQRLKLGQMLDAGDIEGARARLAELVGRPTRERARQSA